MKVIIDLLELIAIILTTFTVIIGGALGAFALIGILLS
jgi:hypothetical protein